MDEYRERVVDYMLGGYREGVTPNPDAMCNREMKFGVFLDFARAQGFDAIATGHYARIAHRPDGSAEILRGVDPNKDQTYFLALLRQEQIRPALFPIGDIPKPQVRSLAKRFGIPVAEKKDSQGICFIGNIKMSDFLSHYIEDRPGPILTLDGREVGRHRGLHLYTLGQRKGLGVASNAFGKAFVVVAKRPESNALVVAFDEPDTPYLYAVRCRVAMLGVTNRALTECGNLSAQPRYRSRPVRVEWQTAAGSEDLVELTFAEPQRALTPGQICAFYEGETLVGGGMFQEIHHESAPTVAR